MHFMNDPNGLVFFDGLYHLYYQYNPLQLVAGNQSWGHATSTDPIHWKNLPIAIPEMTTGPTPGQFLPGAQWSIQIIPQGSLMAFREVGWWQFTR